MDNTVASLFRWVKTAVEELPPEHQTKLINVAIVIVNQGGIRGDISDEWVRRFPTLKDKLKDLYL